MTEPCPHCEMEGHKREEAEGKARTAEQSLTDANTRLGTLGGQVQQLQTDLTTAKTNVHIPALATVIAHCEDGSCSDHGRQWEGIKSQVIQQALEKLPVEVVRQKALEMDLIPGKIIVKTP